MADPAPSDARAPEDAPFGAGPVALRSGAEASASALPPLLASAERLAATVVLGAHGRRRPGLGETFWQYRRANPGDPLTSVDWRRSARSDALFIRETEWEAAQTVWLWSDAAQSMAYRSKAALPRKGDRAALLTAALAVLLSRGGERIAALGTEAARPGFGEIQLGRIAAALAAPPAADDFGAPPPLVATRGGGRAVLISDFFGDEDAIAAAVGAAADQGVSGLLLQVLDPAEEAFPFDGRVIFESLTGALRYKTDRAGALREDYQAALAARRDRLKALARSAGWRVSTHRTDQSAAPALLWLAQALSLGAA